MKNQSIIFGLLFILLGCERNDSLTGEGPLSVYLMGKWELTKISTPRTSKVGSQIGYSEILEIGNDNFNDYEKTYRDSQFVQNYFRDRSKTQDMSVKTMTLVMRYAGSKERLYKIIDGNSLNISLEASAYLEYYYSLKR
jgi:hypothetical protein